MMSINQNFNQKLLFLDFGTMTIKNKFHQHIFKYVTISN